VVIVTGAGGGIGAAAVALLASRGVCVLAVDVDAGSLAALEDADGRIVEHAADVSDETAARAVVADAMTRWGRLDALLNNAAVLGPIASIADYPADDFDAVMRTNVRGVWLCTRHAVPALRAGGGGAVVNVASSAGLMGWPQLSAYVGAKHAVVGITRALAVECATDRIRVNALCPGPTDTPMLRAIGAGMAPGDWAAARLLQEQNVPAGRLGEPEEPAAAAAWLLLDAPPYLTGAIVAVDGGQTAGFGVHQTTRPAR
jgi:NAD(P)-dependent dehydrogenase (short-subunit alcohol dehydrogenase family)